MTVKDLKTQLNNIDDNYDITVRTTDNNADMPITDIRQEGDSFVLWAG